MMESKFCFNYVISWNEADVIILNYSLIFSPIVRTCKKKKKLLLLL
jgi:hypothetical protein